ncbi:response regulator [Halopseudomonas pelagia]|uniref:histidine kinase n=3 Tax=Halopseudomonas pelagia TaxID=553151 RepID=A0ABX6CQI1_9GAMM|nr:response regulator [Halopseudomonas pelagia]QFY56019.1 response regulator [Halopseudomonas pelagia]
MSEIGLKARILLMTLAPTGLLAMALGSYFIWHASQDLQQQLLERGFQTVEHLQIPAAQALLEGQPEEFRETLAKALDRIDVRAVTLYDSERNLLEHSGPTMMPTQRTLGVDTIGAGSGLQVGETVGSSRFLLPLLASPELLEGQSQNQIEADAILGWLEVELSHANTQLRRYQMLLTTLVMVLAGLLLTTFTISQMSRRITDPISLSNRAIAQISKGQLDVRLNQQGSRELDDLAQGINTMAQTLQSAQGELQQNVDQATEDLRQTLETIEIQNIELDMARKTAQEASRIKSEFLANMSHELRTPLNGIIGFSNLLQRTELTNRQQEYLGTIEKSADNLLAIINEILDFSKIEAGKLILENQPFNLRDLIQDTLTMLAPAAHQKNLELVSIIYRDTPIGMSGDGLRLKQILANLVSNAIKFTQEGSVSIRTMLEQEDDTHVLLRISVTDTGIGLTSTQQKSLFQAFTQADNSMSRQAGGTGLGLVIAKRLVEQMHGEIGLDSRPGEGSEFWLTARLEKSTQAGDDLPATPLQGIRAAVMEPLTLSRQALLHNLEDLGLDVTVYDNLSALEIAVRTPHPDEPIQLVLASMRSPGTRADLMFEVLNRWMNDDSCKIILLTDTTEHYPSLDQLPPTDCQVLSRPLCTRKLYRAVNQLFRPEPVMPAVIPGRADKPQITVLCVDDNEANLRLVETFLSEMGARVLTATSGEQALQIADRETIQLIFMDVQMPGMDGRATTTELRLREELADCEPRPIIALTAHALAEERRRLIQCGMNDYLTKPISPEQLSHCIFRWTGINLSMPNTAAPSPAPIPAVAVGPKTLPILDYKEGLQLAAGKADLAQDILAMLIKGLPGDRVLIEKYMSQGDDEALLDVVHRLHGATRYCGVPQLRECCLQAETLLKQGKKSQMAISQLIEAIEQVRVAYHTAEPSPSG